MSISNLYHLFISTYNHLQQGLLMVRYNYSKVSIIYVQNPFGLSVHFGIYQYAHRSFQVIIEQCGSIELALKPNQVIHQLKDFKEIVDNILPLQKNQFLFYRSLKLHQSQRRYPKLSKSRQSFKIWIDIFVREV